VRAGYIEASIQDDAINVVKLPTNGTYLVPVEFLPTEEGFHKVCIQLFYNRYGNIQIRTTLNISFSLFCFMYFCMLTLKQNRCVVTFKHQVGYIYTLFCCRVNTDEVCVDVNVFSGKCVVFLFAFLVPDFCYNVKGLITLRIAITTRVTHYSKHIL